MIFSEEETNAFTQDCVVSKREGSFSWVLIWATSLQWTRALPDIWKSHPGVTSTQFNGPSSSSIINNRILQETGTRLVLQSLFTIPLSMSAAKRHSAAKISEKIRTKSVNAIAILEPGFHLTVASDKHNANQECQPGWLAILCGFERRTQSCVQDRFQGPLPT